ncbi:homologous recombination OB-fold protein isoform X2 [Corythoichthys intestinalis]|uniref:homologous recombination OB-fold protein isoform X2 n=1 Tax=Corythoichthys intestinalis TaxID=161448 RepID=UPI0025A63F41|nr:homologous recombination OB-fold protein isoform X2 [Corythoichthys intestinalis]
MSCQLSGLFSIGEDFDDEDLLGSTWGVAPQTVVPSRPFGAACVASSDSGNKLLQRSASPCSPSSLETAAPTLRGLSSTSRAHPILPELKEHHIEEQKRPTATLPHSMLTAAYVTRKDSNCNLLQPGGDSLHLALKTLTPTLKKPLTVGQALGRQPLSTPAFPGPHVGAHHRPGTTVPSHTLGREKVVPTLQQLSSGPRAFTFQHSASVLPESHSWVQQSPIHSTDVATHSLAATPVIPRETMTNPFKSNTERSPQPLSTFKSDVTELHLGVSHKSAISDNADDDFDDWDLDLKDLEECERLAERIAPVKTLRPTNSRVTERVLTPTPPYLAPMRTITTSSPVPNSFSNTLGKPQQASWRTQTPTHPPRGLFETISPGPSPSSAFSHHPLSTPLLTNHLVQLVSASSKVSRKRPRSEPRPPMTRRFPGPAGLLPQQPQSESLDEIVVSVSHKPAHNVAERPPKQVSSSQSEEEEFSSGPWAAMKAEMGLDERNPVCFLRSYSVVMVLRKAALKQLNKNKVPNMAVMLKSINHTHTDAKAVFKDPTGEIQGTFHRRLLEERLGELKVGVFSPSHRNHYLNVTPKNLLRVYSPDGMCHTSGQLPPLILEPPTSPLPTDRPVSCMQLMFDEDDCDDDGTKFNEENPQNSSWDADDLDELLVALPEDPAFDGN